MGDPGSTPSNAAQLERSFLGRPKGDPSHIRSIARLWREEGRRLDQLRQACASLPEGAAWSSGEGRRSFEAVCDEVAGYVGRLAAPLLELAAQLDGVATAIEQAQHEWDVRIAEGAAGCVVLAFAGVATFGAADAAAGVAAAQMVRTVASIAAVAEGVMSGAGVVVLSLTDLIAELGVGFGIKFLSEVGIQMGANVIGGRSPLRIDYGAAAFAAGVGVAADRWVGAVTTKGPFAHDVAQAALSKAVSDSIKQEVQGGSIDLRSTMNAAANEVLVKGSVAAKVRRSYANQLIAPGERRQRAGATELGVLPAVVKDARLPVGADGPRALSVVVPRSGASGDGGRGGLGAVDSATASLWRARARARAAQ